MRRCVVVSVHSRMRAEWNQEVIPSFLDLPVSLLKCNDGELIGERRLHLDVQPALKNDACLVHAAGLNQHSVLKHQCMSSESMM